MVQKDVNYVVIDKWSTQMLLVFVKPFDEF